MAAHGVEPGHGVGPHVDLVKHALEANLSGAGIEGIRQKIATGEVIHQSNTELSGQSEALLEQLIEKINTGGASEETFRAAAQEMAGVLAPHIQKLGASPALSQEWADRLIGGFKQGLRETVTDKKKLSKEMRDSWQKTLGTFASEFAQENGIDHIATESILKAIGERQSQPAPPAATPENPALSSEPPTPPTTS